MKTARIIIWGAVSWLLLAGLLLLYAWPNLPQSPKQWLLFIAFGPPLYALFESVGSWLLSERHGRAISSRSFSVARTFVALFAAISVVAVCWWLTWLFAH